MTGVIDDHGVQWERCNQCAGWERYDLLAYAPINPALPTPSWAATEDDKARPCDMCRECIAGTPWVGVYRDPALNTCRVCKKVGCDDDCEELAAIYCAQHREQLLDIDVDEIECDICGRSYGEVSHDDCHRYGC